MKIVPLELHLMEFDYIARAEEETGRRFQILKEDSIRRLFKGISVDFLLCRYTTTASDGDLFP